MPWPPGALGDVVGPWVPRPRGVAAASVYPLASEAQVLLSAVRFEVQGWEGLVQAVGSGCVRGRQPFRRGVPFPVCTQSGWTVPFFPLLPLFLTLEEESERVLDTTPVNGR